MPWDDADAGHLDELVALAEAVHALEAIQAQRPAGALVDAIDANAVANEAGVVAGADAGIQQRRGHPVFEGVIAVEADPGKREPALVERFAEHPFELAVALELAEGELLGREGALDQVAAAVTEGSGKSDRIGQGVGVAEGGDDGTQFRGVIHVAFAVEQQRVAGGDQIILESDSNGPPLAVAGIAVVAQGDLA